ARGLGTGKLGGHPGGRSDHQGGQPRRRPAVHLLRHAPGGEGLHAGLRDAPVRHRIQALRRGRPEVGGGLAGIHRRARVPPDGLRGGADALAGTEPRSQYRGVDLQPDPARRGLGMVIDGSWISQNWTEDAPSPWPEWSEAMGVVRMPAQDGGGSGSVTLAGGWCWAIPQHATDPEASASFIEALLTTENTVQRAIEDNQITVRADVAEVEEYQTYSPTAEFFTGLLGDAYYRPAFAEYPEISSAIQEAMETVMTMRSTPEQAAAAYDRA